MEFISEQLINYLEERTKWKDMVAAGKLGKASIRKLHTGGVAKTAKQYEDGIEKGTQNILKKANAKEVNDIPWHHPLLKLISNKTKENLKMLDVDEFNKMGDRARSFTYKGHFGRGGRVYAPTKAGTSNALVKRHEANEALELARKKKKYGFGSMFSGGGTATDGHLHPRVVAKEKRDVELHSRLFGNAKSGIGEEAKAMADLRKYTNEYETLKEKLKDAKKVEKTMGNLRGIKAMIKRLKLLRASIDSINKFDVSDKAKRLRHSTQVGGFGVD